MKDIDNTWIIMIILICITSIIESLFTLSTSKRISPRNSHYSFLIKEVVVQIIVTLVAFVFGEGISELGKLWNMNLSILSLLGIFIAFVFCLDNIVSILQMIMTNKSIKEIYDAKIITYIRGKVITKPGGKK